MDGLWFDTVSAAEKPLHPRILVHLVQVILGAVQQLRLSAPLSYPPRACLVLQVGHAVR